MCSSADQNDMNVIDRNENTKGNIQKQCKKNMNKLINTGSRKKILLTSMVGKRSVFIAPVLHT